MEKSSEKEWFCPKCRMWEPEKDFVGGVCGICTQEKAEKEELLKLREEKKLFSAQKYEMEKYEKVQLVYKFEGSEKKIREGHSVFVLKEDKDSLLFAHNTAMCYLSVKDDLIATYKKQIAMFQESNQEKERQLQKMKGIYQPVGDDKGNLDRSKPPQGGSGIAKKRKV